MGLYDGACPVCGGHIFGAIGENGSHTPWKCGQCGASEENPVFDENKKIPWTVICYEAEKCGDYHTRKCLGCEKSVEIEFPCAVYANGKRLNIKDKIIDGITYRELSEHGNVEVVFMSYTNETHISYNGEKWHIQCDYD